MNRTIYGGSAATKTVASAIKSINVSKNFLRQRTFSGQILHVKTDYGIGDVFVERIDTDADGIVRWTVVASKLKGRVQNLQRS
jgi:hypothetical protein